MTISTWCSLNIGASDYFNLHYIFNNHQTKAVFDIAPKAYGFCKSGVNVSSWFMTKQRTVGVGHLFSRHRCCACEIHLLQDLGHVYKNVVLSCTSKLFEQEFFGFSNFLELACSTILVTYKGKCIFAIPRINPRTYDLNLYDLHT